MYKLLQKDDDLAARLEDLISWLFCEPNPIPLYATSMSLVARQGCWAVTQLLTTSVHPSPCGAAAAATLRWQCAAW